MSSLPSAMQAFDPAEYWEERFGVSCDLTATGHRLLGEPYNRWAYRVRRRAFLRAVRREAPNEVLDVGSGTGFYVDVWRELGVRSVAASDLAAVAVDRLRERYPDADVRSLDISDPLDADLVDRFDAVSAMDVLFHIVDDDRYERAVSNLRAMLRPGGFVVFSEDFLHWGRRVLRHVVSRPQDEIESVLEQAGLVPERRVPVFFLMNTPFDSGSRILDRWWEALCKSVMRWPAIGNPVGCVLAPIDMALGALREDGPSTEIMVCRRPREAT